MPEEQNGPTSFGMALAKLQSSIPPVAKNAKNSHFKSNYATLDAIIEAVRVPMSEGGWSFACFPVTEDAEGGRLHAAALMFVLRHGPTDRELVGTYPIPAGIKIQELGSTMTYLRRYFLGSFLNIATEDDDDGEAASGRVPPKNDPPAPSAPSMTIDGRFLNKLSVDELKKIAEDPQEHAAVQRAARLLLRNKSIAR
jgi:hypothetical protein